MQLTGEEVSLEAPLGDGVVRLELDPHVVVQRGDDLGLLRSAELPVELGVRAGAAAHLHVVVLAHLPAKHRTISPNTDLTD